MMKIYSFVFQEQGSVSHFSLGRFIFDSCFQHGPIPQLSLGLWVYIQAFSESKSPAFCRAGRGSERMAAAYKKGSRLSPSSQGAVPLGWGRFPGVVAELLTASSRAAFSLVSDFSNTTCPFAKCHLSLHLVVSDIYTLEAFYVPLEGTRGWWVFPSFCFVYQKPLVGLPINK